MRRRAWIAFAVLGACLTVLAVTPVLVSMRTRALRQEITEQAEPTISAVSGVERALALQLASLRGFALTRDSAFLDGYADFRAEERAEMRRLTTLADSLDPTVSWHAHRLDSLAAEWHARVVEILQTGEPGVVGALDPSPQLAEARSLRQSVELLERLRRSEIAGVEGFEIWLNRAMILLMLLAGGSLVLLGRRLQGLAASSEAQRLRLEQEVTRRARLIRGISHDLKNPLGVADSHAEFLEMGMMGELSPEQGSSVGAIRRSVRNAVRLIDDLLHLARAERGEVPLRPRDLDFNELAEQLARDMASRAAARGVRLSHADPGWPVPGRADPHRVREILENLLTNAIRYTQPGGEVTLRVRTDERTPSPGKVLLEVSDTGPGIAPADRERIFQEFERASDNEEGTGLGLAISREMARLMGGDIVVESRVGHGSTFTLVLPRVAGRPQHAGAG